jgi:type II secretory pathway component PulM
MALGGGASRQRISIWIGAASRCVTAAIGLSQPIHQRQKSKEKAVPEEVEEAAAAAAEAATVAARRAVSKIVTAQS